MAKCNGTSKRSGGPCDRDAMPNGVCYTHGGKSPGGIASATFKTGRYSKYLPDRLAGRYEQAAADPDLLALRDDIALLDTRIAQTVSALDTGESREAWSSLFALWQQLDQDMSRLLDDGETPETMERTVSSLGETIKRGLSEGYVWSEIRGLLKERAALVAGEQKRLVDMQQYVTATQAMGFVAAVMASVRKHVSDRSALAAISSDLTGLSLRPGSGAHQPTG
jgi:hypothetical protein